MNPDDNIPAEYEDEDEDIPVGQEEPEPPEFDIEGALDQLVKGLPTPFATFDALLGESAPLVTPRGLEPVTPTWQAALQAFDDEFGQLFQFFDWAQNYQERTPDFVKHGARVWDQFEWIQQQINRLGQAAQHQDALEFVLALREMEQCLRVLRKELDALRQIEESQPQLSPAPFVNELLRMGRGFMNGTISKEAFGERLASYQEIQAYVYEQIKSGTGLESDQRQIVDQAFETQGLGLDALFAALERDDMSLLEEGLGQVDEAWMQLLELRGHVQESIVKAGTRPCPRCAHSNEAGNRFCSKCNAKLPDTGEYGPTGQFRLSDSGGGKVLGSNFERIQAAVDKVASGSLSVEDFGSEVAWFRKVHTQSVNHFEKMDEPDDNTPADKLALFEQACAYSSQGLMDIDAGIEMLESYVAGQRGPLGPQELLAQGMAQIRQGGETLLNLENLTRPAS